MAIREYGLLFGNQEELVLGINLTKVLITKKSAKVIGNFCRLFCYSKCKEVYFFSLMKSAKTLRDSSNI